VTDILNVTISGHRDPVLSPIPDDAAHGYDEQREAAVRAFIDTLRELGDVIDYAHFGTTRVNVDLVSGARTAIVPETPVEEVAPVPRLADAHGPQPADPSAPVAEEDGGIVGIP